MSEDNAEVHVWEFVAIVKAAIHTEHDSDEFPESVWDVYCVIERRIADSETATAVGIPTHNKESSVKDVAESIVGDGLDDDTLAECRAYYERVPAGLRSSRQRRQRWSQNQYPYSDDEDFNPY